MTKNLLVHTARVFFLHSVAGGGKAMLLDLLLASVRLRYHQEHSVAHGMAAAGVAAQLLDDGQTAHSAFKFWHIARHYGLPT